MSAVVGPLVVFFLVRDGGPLNKKPPPSMGGTISDVQIAALNPCCSFSVNFTLEGFRGKTASVEAIVTDANSGATAGPVPAFTAVPDADKDQASYTADIPMSGYPPGNYVVTFVLHAPNGSELDRMDSPGVTLH
jgi:hypothetical protein